MPSKAELEQENADLRAQLAVFGVGRAPRPDCTNACPHGVPFHGGDDLPGRDIRQHVDSVHLPGAPRRSAVGTAGVRLI